MLREHRGSAAVPQGTWRDVVRVAGPLVISMLSYTLMGVVDTLLVAQLGQREVAAVGLATTATFTLICFGMGLMNSVKIAVAQADGAGDSARSRETGWHGVAMGIGVGALVLLLMPHTGALVDLMSGGGVLAPIAGEYFAIRLWGAMPLFVGMAAFGFFDGQGLTRIAMRVNVTANFVNIALDVVFIFGLGPIEPMGVAGAAVATVVSQIFQGTMGLWLLVRATGTPRLITWSRARFAQLLDLGLPMGTQWALEVASWAVFAGIVARAGEAHLAAHTIVVRVCSMSFLPGHAIGEAASILTGQAVGAHAPAAARRAVRSAGRVAFILMGAMGLFFVGAGEWLVSLFRSDPDVVMIGGEILMLAALFQLADSVALTRSGALAGAGDTRFVMVMSVGSAWVVLVPLAWLFAVHFGRGATGAWLALTLHISVVAMVMSARWRSGRPLTVAMARLQREEAAETVVPVAQNVVA